jgi:hypothetical protein
MSVEYPGYRIIRRRGNIEAGRFQTETELELYVDPSGRTVFIQFDEHPDELADGTVIRLTLDDGRVLHCQVLGESPLCSIVAAPSPR